MYNSFKPGQIWLDTEGKQIQAHGGSVACIDGDSWKRVKIEHLLTHTMGIEKGCLFEADRYGIPTDDWVDWVMRQPLRYVPGEHYAYSNSTFYLLSVIVERVAGCTLLDFVRKSLFTPLGNP